MHALLLVALVSLPRLGAFLVGLFGLFMLYVTFDNASDVVETRRHGHEMFPDRIAELDLWQVLTQPAELLTLAAYLGLAFLGLFGALHKAAPRRRKIIAGALAALVIVAFVMLGIAQIRLGTGDVILGTVFALLAALPVFLPHPFTKWRERRRS